jgi:galactose mutarotase-like enzyme
LNELVIEDDVLAATVLPEKGAEVRSLLHRPSGTELLFQAPWELPRPGSGGHAFLESYAGGWQELFPNCGDPSAGLPFHGEAATLPWECERDGDALRCSVRTRLTPFRLDRAMRVDDGRLLLDETVTNEGAEPAHFVWGHHLVLGAPFLERGCTIDVPARTIETIAEMWEDTARLEPGQHSEWPHARLRAGGTVDLRAVPGPEAGSHDDVYLTDLDAGRIAVTNPRLGLRVDVAFDPGIFRWVILWQPYGGAHELPLTGAYALGIEPWVSQLPLAEAVAAGEAIELAAGASFSTSLSVGAEWHG